MIAVIDAWGSVERALEAAGAYTVDSDYDVSPEAAEKLVAAVDGVVFTGGGDVAPKHYRQEPLRSTNIAGYDRDRGELLIARAARRAGIPMMGICRGHQLLNVAYGGTLHQHLPLHRNGKVNHGYSQHRVKFSPKSMIGEWLKRENPEVTSLHHQGVDRVGPGLIAVGWALDGTVEALESVNEPYVLGVQFHPEMDFGEPGCAWAGKVFYNFVRQVRSTMVPNEQEWVARLDAIPRQSYSYSYGHGYHGVAWDDDWDGYSWDVNTNRWKADDEEGSQYSRWKRDALATVDKVLDYRRKGSEKLTDEITAIDDYDPTVEDAQDMVCMFPPCELRDSCTPEYGGCFREWRAMNGGKD